MEGIRAVKAGFTYHSLNRSPMEELAAAVRLRVEPTPGEAFAKKIHQGKASGIIKAEYSRVPVLNLYGRLPGHLHLLTMPGLKWPFERSLLKYRRQDGQSTQFTCVESGHAIYRAGLAWLPRGDGGVVTVVDNNTVETDLAWYENIMVEDLIARCNQDFDGAWLDFTGPLTPHKLKALHELWLRVNHSLVVTFMAARYDSTIGKLLTAAGGWDKLLMAWLKVPPGRCHMTAYMSPTISNGVHHVNKMVQITLRRRYGGF